MPAKPKKSAVCKLERETHGSTLLIRAEGHLDRAGSEKLLKMAEESEAKRLVVVLSNVTYLSSPGVGALVHVAKGRDLRLVCSSESSVRAVLEVVGVDHAFRFFPDEDLALKAPAPRPPSSGTFPAIR